ncbi:MAG: C4-dicarboxylate ABC transporter substrate-binding protein, partial [Planctomycetota bacterium]|nr:C4-dicarboxylate ABC transporter substrate-binding protein [Planctomycetota bacterium]
MKQTTFIALLVVVVVGMMAAVFLRSNTQGESGTKNASQDVPTLKGAVQFGEEHAFTRTIRKFEELVREYYGKPVDFELYLNSELGLEKDYFAYMSQGISVDYGIVSPAHMSTFSESAPLMDMPFLFRDVDHWNMVLESDAL